MSTPLRCVGCDRAITSATSSGISDMKRQKMTLKEWTHCYGCGKNVCVACGGFSGAHTSWRDHRNFAQWIGYAPKVVAHTGALYAWAKTHGAGGSAHPFVAPRSDPLRSTDTETTRELVSA